MVMKSAEKVYIKLDFKKYQKINILDFGKDIDRYVKQNKFKIIVFDASTFPVDCNVDFSQAKVDSIICRMPDHPNLRLRTSKKLYDRYKEYYGLGDAIVGTYREYCIKPVKGK